MQWRVRFGLNLINLSTPLGLAAATVGRARLSRGPRGLILATEYRLSFPRANAFTVGNVILSKHDLPELIGRRALLRHEERHATQYAWCLGVLMLPMYGATTLWSYARGGDHSTHNLFETRAGLTDGGYALVSARDRARPR